MIKENTKVKLKTFNGTSDSEPDCDDSENYWKLIGFTGAIAQDPNEANLNSGNRFLVKFDADIQSLGLHCHNNVENSLWILESDLEIIS